MTMKRKSQRLNPTLLTAAMAVILMILLGSQGCTENKMVSVEEPGPKPLSLTNEEPLSQMNENRWETVTFDGWRQYAFDPATLVRWVDDEGNTVIDVWVRVTYVDMPGTAVYDVQKWHVDDQRNRYRISDNFSYDEENHLCET